MLLIGNGLTFVCQAIVFLVVGDLVDYRNWNRGVFWGFFVLSWAFQFAFLACAEPISGVFPWRPIFCLVIRLSSLGNGWLAAGCIML